MKIFAIDNIPRTQPALPISGRDHIQGQHDARLQLLEYGDYECPHCGEAFGIVKRIQQRLDGRMCFAFRNFPLAIAHPHAMHAAEAAEAAASQGRFWEMHDILFKNQGALDDENFADYALFLGLDAERLLREIVAGSHRARVREDFISGTRLDVNGTPTFFINGIRYDGPATEHALFAALTEAYE